jgi:catechol 2,3-dioxygenase-like lactoylglutathione lyase family enzyme
MSAPYHFDCIFYYVSDIERAVEFYQDVLGFKLTSCDVVARFDIDGVLFELVPASDAEKLGGSGNARLALRVDDIRQAVARLSAR